MAASSSVTPVVRSCMSCVSFAIVALRSSVSAVSRWISSAFASRVCLFVVSSVSHQPLCSVSAADSCMSFEIRSLIILFTLSKGSLATCWAMSSSVRLLQVRARPLRNDAMRAWSGLWLLLLLRSCISATPLWRTCSIDGRYFSPAPATLSLERISTASLMDASSSARSFWRLSKSLSFVWQSAVMSSRYFWSSARSAVVCARLPSASALACWVSARRTSFLEISC
mmetsp:Transcript_52445/g.135338  ORF Transcript_52445/g.135338 Transcript_52445/m.135338 type:complete len:226 (-) Transcript_52445:830-1507(-)